MFLEPIRQSSEKDLACFVGVGWTAEYRPLFRKICHQEKMVLGDHIAYINWLALLYPPAWLLYRKLHAYCACLLILMYGPDLLLGSVYIPTIVFMLATALLSRPLYLHYAAQKIAAIRKDTPDESEAIAKITSAGGVSTLAGWVGLILPIVIEIGILWVRGDFEILQSTFSEKAIIQE